MHKRKVIILVKLLTNEYFTINGGFLPIRLRLKLPFALFLSSASKSGAIFNNTRTKQEANLTIEI
jgi:hypothetical protein